MNDILDPIKMASRLISRANSGNATSLRYVQSVINGPSQRFIGEVKKQIKGMRVVREMEYLPKSGRFRWNEKIEFPTTPKPHWRDALSVCIIIGEGITNKIHLCHSDDCGKYFVGDYRSRWCSKSCGSRQRTRWMRDRNLLSKLKPIELG